MEKLEISTKILLADFDALEKAILDCIQTGYKISSGKGCIIAEVPEGYKKRILEKFNFYRAPSA